jgi:hypothetical protein
MDFRSKENCGRGQGERPGELRADFTLLDLLRLSFVSFTLLRLAPTVAQSGIFRLCSQKFNNTESRIKCGAGV